MVKFLVVSPVALVQYVPQRAKDNKMQSFTSLLPPADVASFLYYVPIFIISPESQDTPLDSLLMVGICFQTLWACVGAVGCVCNLTQVGGGVVDLCPGQYSHWHLRVMHALFQLVPVLHIRGCLFARGLKILLQTLFWFGSQLPPSMGQFQGFCNRHTRTSTTFPHSLNSLPLSHRRCLYPQLGDNFHPQRERRRKPCQEYWWGSENLEFLRGRN